MAASRLSEVPEMGVEPPATSTVATAIAAEIQSAGIDRVFGIPGGEVLSLIEALRQQGTEFVLCNHEASAGMMASAYGRIRGHPGVVMTTLGPGAANLLLPLSNAQLERESLLAISGDLGASLPASHTHQRLDLIGIFSPTVKYASALTPEEAPSRLRAALAVIAAPPEGAALLTLSTEAAASPAGEASESDRLLRPNAASAGDPGTDGQALAEALARSRRPLVVVGCGAEWASATGLTEWLTRWKLPVALTPKAKGLVRDDYEQFIGVLDGAGLGSLMSRTLAGADLIVGLGLDPVELIRPWHATAPVIWVGNCGPEDELARDAKRLHSGVGSVTEELAAADVPAGWTDWTSEAVAERRALADDECKLTWVPRALRAALPDSAIVTTDVGSHKCLISQFLPMGEPGRFLTSNGLSAMGYGLPAAIGAKLAEPETPVLSVVGDGGFAMAAQELETSVRLGAPVIVVVLVDSSLSLIQLLQQTRGLPRCGVDYGRVDILAVAQGYGAKAATAATSAELSAAVEQAVRSDVATVIAVPIDAAGYRELL
jgi:acetolactate synthase-1/2/3 large subunit